MDEMASGVTVQAEDCTMVFEFLVMERLFVLGMARDWSKLFPPPLVSSVLDARHDETLLERSRVLLFDISGMARM